MTKAPSGGGKTGPDLTDRGKTGTRRLLLTDGRGLPLALAGADVIDFKLLGQTLAAIEAPRPILVRWEKLTHTCEAMLRIACAVTVWVFVCLLDQAQSGYVCGHG